jgi:hypothetical protein
MPYKANADRRHKFPKARCGDRDRVCASSGFSSAAPADRGGDAIDRGPCLASISRSRITPTFSQRGGGLKILPQRVERDEPLHGIRSRRRWRKLHLAVDADTQEIAAVELTTDDVGDVSALPDLLDQIEHPIGSVTADGAYDGDPVYDEVLQRHPTARVIIPPRARAVLSEAGTTQRDEHLRSIEAHGRIGWQHRVGYGKRSLVETAMYRYQTIIGRRLHPSSGYSTGRPPLVSNETGS